MYTIIDCSLHWAFAINQCIFLYCFVALDSITFYAIISSIAIGYMCVCSDDGVIQQTNWMIFSETLSFCAEKLLLIILS